MVVTRSSKKSSQVSPIKRRIAPDERPPTPQTPQILRGDCDDDPNEESPTGFNRYISRQKQATLMKKLYLKEYSGTSRRKRRNSFGDVRILHPVKKIRSCGSEYGNVRDRERVDEGAVREVRRNVDPANVDPNPEERENGESENDVEGRNGEERRAESSDGSTDGDSEDQENDERATEEEVVDQGQQSVEERSDGELSEGEDSEGEGSQGDRSEGERSNGERHGSQRSDKERSDEDHGDSERTASEQSGGERREGEESNRRDFIFPGEDYRPPRTVRFNRGRCNRTSNTTAHVVINYVWYPLNWS